MANQQTEKRRLRRYLNPYIKGDVTDAFLEAFAEGLYHLIYNVEAVNDQFFLATATGKYLDEKMAARNLTRPDNVGLADDTFRALGIEVSNRKQVRDLILKILNVIYGDEYIRATMPSSVIEPYNFDDGDNLILSFDDQDPVEITFQESFFGNIDAATAQEVADTITREIRRLGKKGYCIVQDDGNGYYPVLISNTNGPSSSVKVLGGKVQNVLRFPQLRPTSNDETTQWQLEIQPSGNTRATWISGANPSIGKVVVGDYINIYSNNFNELNKGTFNVTLVQGGDIGNAYIEFDNNEGVNESKVQEDGGVLFFHPKKNTLNDKTLYTAVYQTEARILEIIMPATTKVIRRDRVGSSHFQDGLVTDGNYGPYIFDTTKPYTISEEECFLESPTSDLTNNVLTVDDSGSFPDTSGYVVFDWGGPQEEGPVPYVSRPSSGSLMVDPSYDFQYLHDTGASVTLIDKNYAYTPSADGTDYPFYITDTVSGRLYAEDLIDLVAATGINVVITILYPGDVGLGKWGTDNSEKYVVWGEDED